MLGTLGWQELLLIGLILALLLGASRVSEMGRGLGAAVREFRKGVAEPEPSASDHSSAPPTTDAALAEPSGEEPPIGGQNQASDPSD
jgi:TatA/E family protein of Tat protein translocase